VCVCVSREALTDASEINLRFIQKQNYVESHTQTRVSWLSYRSFFVKLATVTSRSGPLGWLPIISYRQADRGRFIYQVQASS
jgi:hypothetical protein